MQPTASLTFFVTTARADRRAMDSKRGLASKLSPTQTAENAPESSPRLAISNSSGTVTAPMITPRFANVSPKEAIMSLSEMPSSVGVYSIRLRAGESRDGIHHEGHEAQEEIYFTRIPFSPSVISADCHSRMF